MTKTVIFWPFTEGHLRAGCFDQYPEQANDFGKGVLMGLKVLALGTALAMAAQGAQAQEATPIQKMQAAKTLFEIGVQAQDPLYMLAAARLRKSVPLKAAERAPDGKMAAEGAPLGWDDMLTQAEELAYGNSLLTGLIGDIRAERNKGVVNGPVYSIVTLKAGGRDEYPGITFRGGEYAEIYVEGTSGSDLNLLVRDAQGRLVCSDTDISDIAYCGWRPPADEAFTVTVVSEGARGGEYSMMTN